MNKQNNASIAPVFSFVGLFSFKGRRNRLPFFWMNTVLCFASAFIAQLVPSSFFWILPILLIYFLILTNTAKRFHDLGDPGYLCCYRFVDFLPMLNPQIPELYGACMIINFFGWCYTTFGEGERGKENKYGADPLPKQQ